MFKHKFWPIFTVVMLLVLAGCAPVTVPQTATNASASPTVEQTFTIGAAQDVGELNPHNYSSSFPALDMVYEPLVRYAADGSIQPGLAEKWEISADGLTWTFHLRQGVTFQDGEPFNAAAAKWNLEQWIGSKDHNWLPTANKVDSITTPDEQTVVLHMKEFYYAALQELSLVRPVRFLSPKAVDSTGKFIKPVGTGPWQLQDYQKDQRAVFVPNPHYWGDKPKLSKVIFEVIPDPQTRVAALLSGEVQLIGGEYVGSIPLESIQTLQDSTDVTLLTAEGSTAYELQMNFKEAPFDDIHVRAAINHAIDRVAISKQVFRGHATPAQGVFPSVIPYVTYPHPEIYAYDVTKAKALLAEAGWKSGADGILVKDGKPLAANLIFDGAVFPQAKSMAEVIQAELKEIGMQVTTQVLENSAWYDALGKGQYDLTIQLTWGSPYDPHSSVTAFFQTDKGTSHGQIYNSPELDKMIVEVLGTKDEAARKALYTSLWTKLDEQVGAAPIVFSQRIYAVRKNVAGFELAGTEYELDLKDVTITQP